MTNVALWVKMEAKKGKESEVERFLKECLSLAENESGTIGWYACRLGNGMYAIFDTFSDNRGRDAHLAGEIAKNLRKKTPELFTQPPTIERVDVIASKMTELEHH